MGDYADIRSMPNSVLIETLERFKELDIPFSDNEVVYELVNRLKKSEAMVRMLSDKLDDYYWRR